jgi:acetylornithine deacetylase/succinyl-diaminopimelate desuccinylase-like protein
VAVGPSVSPGFTDSILARPLGTHAYGFVPFEVDADHLATMHGPNERVPTDEVARGVRTLFEVAIDVAADLGDR